MTPTSNGGKASATYSVWPERIVAIVLFALGVIFLLRARAYGIGTPQQMGPGYFPAVLGAAICLLAALIGLTHRHCATGQPVAWRSLAMVGGGIFALILVMPNFGLVPALFLCTLIVSRADRHTTSVQAAIVASGLAAGAWLLFIQVLGLPIPTFGSGH